MTDADRGPGAPETLSGFVDRLGSAYGGRPALTQHDRVPLSYAELAAACGRLRARLRAERLGPEARIGIVMPDGVPMAVTTLSVAAAATAVPLNPAYTPTELRPLLRRMGVRALILDAGIDATVAGLAHELGLTLLRTAPGNTTDGAVLLRTERRAVADPGPAVEETTAEGADPDPHRTALVLHTSGSTAEPKLVPLTDANLLASAGNVARSLGLGPDDVCLSALPMFHIGALVDLLLAPISVGGRVVVAGDMSATAFLDHLEAFRPTWYQAVPTMLQAILRALPPTADGQAPSAGEVGGRPGGVIPPGEGGPGLRFIRSVSAPLPATLLSEVETRLGVPVIEIYGMTETAGVITSNPLPPGERRPGSVGVPVGPELVVADEAGNRLGPTERGEVLVRGPGVTPGYEGEEGAGSFLGSWLRTGDEGWVDEDGYLYLTGRIKEIVNRGGEKISPREVDDVVAAHPEVLEAAAFATPHETLGEDVALAVVTRTEPADRPRLTAELQALCRGALAPYKVPRRITYVERLPRAPGGKLRRHLISTDGAATASTSAPDARAPGAVAELTLHQARVREAWLRVLPVDDVQLDDDFFDLGGDSLAATELVEVLSGTELATRAAALFDHPTLRAFAAAIEPDGVTAGPESGPRTGGDAVAAAEPPSPETEAVLTEVRGFLSAWKGRRIRDGALLVPRNTVGHRPPLFFGVQSYGELEAFADAVGADQPIYGMRSLHGARSKSDDNLRLLARHYAAEIEAAIAPARVVDMGGYCAGARVAHLAARALSERGVTVRFLGLMEHWIRDTWPGPVDYFFHVDSGFHPFRSTDRHWARELTGPVRLHPTHAGHERILTDPPTIAALRTALSGARSTDDPPSIAEWPADGRIDVRLEAPRVTTSRATGHARVAVTNPGPAALPRDSVVFVRWGRPGTSGRVFDGRVALGEPLEAGASLGCAVELTAPMTPGRWRLYGAVVPAGDWTAPVVYESEPIGVLVLPGPAVLGYIARRMPGRNVWSSLFGSSRTVLPPTPTE